MPFLAAFFSLVPDVLALPHRAGRCSNSLIILVAFFCTSASHGDWRDVYPSPSPPPKKESNPTSNTTEDLDVRQRRVSVHSKDSSLFPLSGPLFLSSLKYLLSFSFP